MPIYEYFCDKCELHDEKILPISEGSKKIECKKCGFIMRKLVSAGTFKFEGKAFSASSSKPQQTSGTEVQTFENDQGNCDMLIKSPIYKKN